MAKTQKCQIVGKKLPPTENSFHQHLLRTIYQLIIWKQAHIPFQELPDPTEFGYNQNEVYGLQPKLMTQDVSAPELLNDFMCECPDDACNMASNCTCFTNSQSCTTACSCNGNVPGIDNDKWCSNPFTLATTVSDNDSDSD